MFPATSHVADAPVEAGQTAEDVLHAGEQARGNVPLQPQCSEETTSQSAIARSGSQQHLSTSQAQSERKQSKYRGVCWNKKNKRWQASINVDGQYVYIGSFVDEIEAAKAFDDAAVTLRGDNARTNFPQPTQLPHTQIKNELPTTSNANKTAGALRLPPMQLQPQEAAAAVNGIKSYPVDAHMMDAAYRNDFMDFAAQRAADMPMAEVDLTGHNPAGHNMLLSAADVIDRMQRPSMVDDAMQGKPGMPGANALAEESDSEYFTTVFELFGSAYNEEEPAWVKDPLFKAAVASAAVPSPLQSLAQPLGQPQLIPPPQTTAADFLKQQHSPGQSQRLPALDGTAGFVPRDAKSLDADFNVAAERVGAADAGHAELSEKMRLLHGAVAASAGIAADKLRIEHCSMVAVSSQRQMVVAAFSTVVNGKRLWNAGAWDSSKLHVVKDLPSCSAAVDVCPHLARLVHALQQFATTGRNAELYHVEKGRLVPDAAVSMSTQSAATMHAPHLPPSVMPYRPNNSVRSDQNPFVPKIPDAVPAFAAGLPPAGMEMAQDGGAASESEQLYDEVVAWFA